MLLPYDGLSGSQVPRNRRWVDPGATAARYRRLAANLRELGRPRAALIAEQAARRWTRRAARPTS